MGICFVSKLSNSTRFFFSVLLSALPYRSRSFIKAFSYCLIIILSSIQNTSTSFSKQPSSIIALSIARQIVLIRSARSGSTFLIRLIVQRLTRLTATDGCALCSLSSHSGSASAVFNLVESGSRPLSCKLQSAMKVCIFRCLTGSNKTALCLLEVVRKSAPTTSKLLICKIVIGILLTIQW